MEDTEISFPESLLRRNFVMANTKKKTTPVATKKDNTVEIPVVAAMTKAEPKKEAKVEAKKEAEVKKAEPKKVEKAVEVKTVAKKEDKAPAKAATKVAEKKPAAKKATTTKKAATTAKKAPAKAAKVENNIYVQFSGMEFDTAAIEKAVKADYTAKNGKKDMKSVSIYIKPEDMKAYYVIDGIIGDVAL
jgi:outer membrane biosynthesis protein TonB